MHSSYTVHDTKNLTFLRNSIVVPRGHLRIVVRYDVDLPQGDRGSFAGRPWIFCVGGHESSVDLG